MRGGRASVLHALRGVVATLVLLGSVTAVHAIDNPEAPDRVGEFESRAQSYERNLSAADGGSAAVREGQAYARFLNAELDAAYATLLSRLYGPAREEFVQSQRRWLRFRDAEYRFIEQHWTRERNGTSFSLSIADHRNALVKDRVRQILRYAAEYR